MPRALTLLRNLLYTILILNIFHIIRYRWLYCVNLCETLVFDVKIALFRKFFVDKMELLLNIPKIRSPAHTSETVDTTRVPTLWFLSIQTIFWHAPKKFSSYFLFRLPRRNNFWFNRKENYWHRKFSEEKRKNEKVHNQQKFGRFMTKG